MKKILLLVLFIFVFISGYQSVQALTISGYDLGGNLPYTTQELNDGQFLLFEDEDNYYFLWSDIDENRSFGIYALNIAGHIGGSTYKDAYYYKIDKITKEIISTTQGNKWYKEKVPILLTVDYNRGDIIFTKNYSQKLKLNHGDKYSVYNNASSIMYSNFSFQKSSVTMQCIVMLTDESGNFIEQYFVDVGSGYELEITLPPKATTNIFVTMLPLHIDEYLSYNLIDNEYLSFSEYVPTYKIVGQSTVKLNGLFFPGVTPYIKTNYTTPIFYQYIQNGITYTKTKVLTANQNIYFDENIDYLIKFRHPSNVTISVQSNFTLNNTSERISLLSDDDLEELIINNGGSFEESENDAYFEVDRFKAFKITGLNEGVVTESVTIDIQGDSNSNADIHIYSYNWSNLFKSNEVKQIGNQGRYRISVPSNNGYIVIKENAGKTFVRIPAKFKADENYSTEYIVDWVADSSLDDEYYSVNSTPKPIQEMNDNSFKPVSDNFWDSLFGGSSWSGVNPDGQENQSSFALEFDTVKGVAQEVSSITDVFVEPVKNIFTGIPAIYMLIIFGFGISLVKFVLGR